MSGNVPSIRFSGFTDPWEQRKLGELYTVSDQKNVDGSIGVEKTISVSSMSWNPEGNGASADSLPAYKVLNYGDMAFEGNRTKGHSYGKLVINDIGKGIMSSRFRTLRPVSEVCVPFWKYCLQDSDAWKPLFIRSTKRGTLMTELVPGELLKGAIYLPDMPEQVAIGSLFTHLDSLITLHQRECDRLEKVRASLMQSMFPQPGETLPSIRFAEFTKPWHSKQLGSLVTPFDHRIPTPTDGYVRLGVRSFAKGTFLQDVPAEQAIGETELREVGPNNLIVNIVFAWEQAIAITSEADTIALVSHRFPQFSFNDGQCPDFYRYALLDPRFRHHLWLASPSGAGRNKTLRVDEMLEYWILVPSFEEQRAIADFFAAFDRSLDARRRLCEALGHVKNALLSSMFV